MIHKRMGRGQRNAPRKKQLRLLHRGSRSRSLELWSYRGFRRDARVIGGQSFDRNNKLWILRSAGTAPLAEKRLSVHVSAWAKVNDAGDIRPTIALVGQYEPSPLGDADS